MKRCLLVDDLPEALALVATAISSAFPDIAQTHCRHYSDAIRLIQSQSFDLALIDLELDQGHGTDLIRILAEKQPGCIPVVSTIFDDDRNLFGALQAGAQGYVLKDQPLEVLAMQLKRIEEGDRPLSPPLARRLIAYFRGLMPHDAGNDRPGASTIDVRITNTMQPDTQKPEPGTAITIANDTIAEATLSAREAEVLQLLANGLRTIDVAVALNISRHTAADHVKAIYRKLNISSRAEAALHARRLGLVRYPD